jgi:hypothetical protein
MWRSNITDQIEVLKISQMNQYFMYVIHFERNEIVLRLAAIMKNSRFLLLGLIVFPLALAAQFNNIVLSTEAEGKLPPMEPSILINPNQPNNIVAGIAPDYCIVSSDGGITWKGNTLKSYYGVVGNPALVSDPKGNMYYFHLADPSGKGPSAPEWLDRISCQKSTNSGSHWGAATFVGLTPPKDNKYAWPATHSKKDLLVVTWTQFDQYGSSDSTQRSNIMFSKSTNKGDRWSDPVVINKLSGDCLDGDYTTIGASPMISFDEKIFVVWSHAGNIYLDRSYDDGKTWIKNDMSIAKQIGGSNYKVPGINATNGIPVTAIDNSGSPFHGSLYVVWADQRNGEDDTDIWMSRSSNRGDNWSSPTKVNQDGKGKHQFMPWVTVDQTNGILYVLYYDRRNHDDNKTDVYLAWSMDSGNKFSEVKISEAPFTPDESKPFGNYVGISAYKNIIAPIWTRMDEGKTKVLTAVVKQGDLVKK